MKQGILAIEQMGAAVTAKAAANMKQSAHRDIDSMIDHAVNHLNNAKLEFMDYGKPFSSSADLLGVVNELKVATEQIMVVVGALALREVARSGS